VKFITRVITRIRRHGAYRFGSRTARIAAAILAVTVVATLTVDLGPAVRGWAERQGSKQLKRPIHIGALHFRLLTGGFVVSDFSIEGLRPADRPFFSARRLDVTLNWTTLVRKEVTIETVALSDWRMVVEKWPDRSNFPKLGGDESNEPDRPKRFTTTLRLVRATKGEFIYDDHEKPWSVIARNLEIAVTGVPSYHGEATFNGGTVTIQDYVPMWANMHARFTIEKSRVKLQRIDLETDGASSVCTGVVDLKHWPEQTYQVKSRVHFPRMREIFFAHETWRVSGDANFNGTFHLFKGGHDLQGAFASDLAGVNDYRFPSLYGSLRWTPSYFRVWNAGSKFYGGASTFTYAIEPLGVPERPTQRFDATYSDVDLAAFSDFEALRGLRFAGRASGSNSMQWPSGRFSERRGEGRVVAAAPPGVATMTPAMFASQKADRVGGEWGPFGPVPLAPHLPVAGEIAYRFGGDGVEVAPSRFATERTHVAFQGSTAWGDRSRFAFHVTSGDWQESDQVLAGILTDFGSRTGTVPVGGRGEFDGMMTGPFRRPRVEGEFDGAAMRAWDTLWGGATAHLLVENGYVRVTSGVVRLADSEIRADGLFSLGYPRDDQGQEIDARFRIVKRDLESLRHAFQLDDYPVTGLLSGDFHLTGRYEHPIGFGGMTIDNGTAYTEPFQKATASLRFDGSGVRLDGVTIEKNGGTVTGAAFVGWDSTYSFNADGRRIPIERLSALSVPDAPPLSGLGEFTAGGSGTFDQPRYEVRFRASSVFIGEEGIGQVTGTLALRGKELSGDVAAASPRLAITGTGRIALTPQADAEITFRFHDSSLDPYVRLFVPQLSPFTTAVGSGTIRVVGELTDLNHLLVDGSIDALEMSLFDYAVRNRGTLHIAMNQQEVRLGDDRGPLELVGDGTALRVAGTVGIGARKIALNAAGEANVGILQGFFKDVRSSGRAELTAAIDGPLSDPVFSGRALITDGRLRHFSMPNSLDAINGTLRFDARGIRLDEISAKLGEGNVQFGGRIGFKGYFVDELDVTARGEDMRLRYPEGVRSIVNADLFLRGSVKAPTLGGVVTVKNAAWTKPFDTPGSIFDTAARREPSSTGGGAGAPPPVIPLKFDLRMVVPSTLHVDNNLIRQLVASADLQLVGTYDRPVLSGHADVERGELVFEGRRYKLTRGTIGFYNPTRIDPFFDIQAETTVRVPGQTYRVTVSAAGTTDRLVPTFDSDPPLPPVEVVALLFSEARRDVGAGGSTASNPELRALQNPNQAQTDILTARATQAFTSSLSGGVGKVVEQTFGVDTFQLTPSFFDPYNQQSPRVSPSARVTIGKRISDRVYLTFSRSLNTTVYDQIILLEYDASDRLSWLLSRNEDQSYALEFRVRHVF
jgi:hypothetical protein